MKAALAGSGTALGLRRIPARAEWAARHGICGQLDDLRYAEFGLKLLYAEQPAAMPSDARQDIERHIRERLLAEGAEMPWLTIAGALGAVATHKAEGEDIAFLNEIEEFIFALKHRLG
jgi:hypothetical protein